MVTLLLVMGRLLLVPAESLAELSFFRRKSAGRRDRGWADADADKDEDEDEDEGTG